MPLKAPSHFHPKLSSVNRDHFIDFVRRVSPEADPTSVLLFGQIHLASNQLTQVAEKELSAAGLSWAKFRMLMSLHHAEKQHAFEGLQPSELSSIQGISRNTVSALIAALEEDGLVSRTLHGKDHRRFVIQLTVQGRKVMKANLDRQFKLVSRYFEHFDTTERSQLLELLVRLNESRNEKAK